MGLFSGLGGPQSISRRAISGSSRTDGRLTDYLLDRVGRAERELALRVKAEINHEDRPFPTHAMFDPAAYAGDKDIVAWKDAQLRPLNGVAVRGAATVRD